MLSRFRRSNRDASARNSNNNNKNNELKNENKMTNDHNNNDHDGSSNSSSSENGDSKKEQEMIHELKSIGRKHGDSDSRQLIIAELEKDIARLVTIMKDYRSNKHIQRVACHAISNMAIHQDKCPILTKYQCHKLILKTVFEHISDWKMCWLAGSAIWNLARPETCRKQFDIKTLKLLYRVIKQHSKVHLVIETSLGALSNLVLYESLRNESGKFEILQNIIDVIRKHKKHCNVATASAGLITNLAHSNLIASKLTDIGAVRLVIEMMKIHSHDTHLQRNCCAALSNMASSSGYVTNLVESLGIERLFAALNLASINPQSQIEPLAEQALLVVDIDWTQMRLSSLHVACKLGLYESTYKILKENIDINKCVDSNGNTGLHYAIRYKKPEIVKLLISRGALLTIKNKFGLTANRALQDMIVPTSKKNDNNNKKNRNNHFHTNTFEFERDNNTNEHNINSNDSLSLDRNVTETIMVSVSTDFPIEKPNIDDIIKNNPNNIETTRIEQYKQLQSAIDNGLKILSNAKKTMSNDICENYTNTHDCNCENDEIPNDIFGVIVGYLPAMQIMDGYGIDDSKLPETSKNKLESCMSTYSLEEHNNHNNNNNNNNNAGTQELPRLTQNDIEIDDQSDPEILLDEN